MKKIRLALILVAALFLAAACAPGYHGWGGHWGPFHNGHYLSPYATHYGPHGYGWR